jgi:hypothetical protein
MRSVILLGPQRFRPNLAETLDSIGCGDHVALVSAGWQEREDEIGELAEHCRRTVVPLKLYQRAERVMSGDESLAAALRERQDQLQELQSLYRLRLSPLLDAARSLLRRPDRGTLIDEHRRAAIRAVRTLDRQNVVRSRKIHAEFDEHWSPLDRPSVRRELEALNQAIEGTSAVLIAGGHVAVLLNRLRLFDLARLVGDRAVVAWSAGAMAIGERVVLFHDFPPQGAGDAEVLEAGLGLHAGLVPLPNASQRLDLEDPLRVSLFARRFAPAVCVPLETGVRVDRVEQRWIPRSNVRVLGRRGRVNRMRKP